MLGKFILHVVVPLVKLLMGEISNTSGVYLAVDLSFIENSVVIRTLRYRVVLRLSHLLLSEMSLGIEGGGGLPLLFQGCLL